MHDITDEYGWKPMLSSLAMNRYITDYIALFKICMFWVLKYYVVYSLPDATTSRVVI